MELTHKQESFAQAVAAGDTYSDAYRKSYNCNNMSQKSIWEKSSELMSDVKVSSRVAELREKTVRNNEMTITEILEKLANWVRFNPKSIMNPDGTVKEFAEMTDEEAECIQDFQVREIYGDGAVVGVIKSIKLIDKRATADMFMKKFGMYVDKIKLDVQDLSHLQEILDGINK